MPNPKEPAMISRLTASAVVFAILAAATLTFAADAQQQRVSAARHDPAATAPAEIIMLPRVEIIAHRAR
jgi:hypothetical protein